MGAVFVRRDVHDAFMQGPPEVIDFFHGFTYSGHPVACAAALATLDVYRREGLLTRAKSLETVWADAIHSLRDVKNVVDIRNIGLMGAVELTPRDGAPGARGYAVLTGAFERGLLLRTSGDTVALSPPLIVTEDQIGEMFTILRGVLESVE
jgi:beta-alanine--pyruvate transaminase